MNTFLFFLSDLKSIPLITTWELADLAEMKETLEKGPFPELAKLLETVKVWYAFQTKVCELEDELTDEQLNALFEEFKTILPTFFASTSLKVYAEGSFEICIQPFMQDDAKMLEIANLTLKNLEGKKGEDWDYLRDEMTGAIEKINLKNTPIQFTAKEGATLDELKLAVDKQVQAILEFDEPKVMLKKLDELKTAVAAVKNEELDAYTAWETGLFTFFIEFSQSKENTDGNAAEKAETEKPDVLNLRRAWKLVWRISSPPCPSQGRKR